MRTATFDLEANGFLAEATVIHCGVVKDRQTGEIFRYGPDQIKELIEKLKSYDRLAGQNICGYDIPLLEKLHGYDPHKQDYLDTLAMSRVHFPGSNTTSLLRLKDTIFVRKYGEASLPKELRGSHSLKAWSLRLRMGNAGKKEYDAGFDEFSDEMLEYNEGDVIATDILLDHFLSKGWPERMYEIESMMLYWVGVQERVGIGFNEEAAIKLAAELSERREVLHMQLLETFPPIEVEHGPVKVAKVARNGRKVGEKYRLKKMQEFNPGSPAQVAQRLIDLHDWKPKQYGKGGVPTLTDDILGDLPWPEAQQCAEYRRLTTILGYIQNGKGPWLELVENGRIHGRIDPIGAVSHRAAHSKPNLGNVPSTKKPYGKECRALFRAGGGPIPADWVMVGADASALQLAIYAHYVAPYDDGVLAAMCEDPKGDPHEYMRQASGLYYRDNQKTVTYATWFGAQGYKVGTIALADWRRAYEEGLTSEPAPALKHAERIGEGILENLRKNMAGYAEITRKIEEASKRGYVVGLDGRQLPVSAARLALVSLLQGNEAIVMKHAFCRAGHQLRDLIYLGTAFPMLWVHDEFQWGSIPELASRVGETLAQAITDAGATLGLRLKLGAEFKIGKTWGDTH